MLCFVASGLFQEIEADSALCPETTRRAQDQSPGQGGKLKKNTTYYFVLLRLILLTCFVCFTVVPGLTTENEDPKAMVRVRDLAMVGENTNFYSHVFLFSRVGQVTYCVIPVC